MKKHIYLSFALAALLLASAGAQAQTPAPADQPAVAANPQTDALKQDLETLVGKIREKIQDGQTSETNFTGELKEFDALAAKYKGGDQDELAQVAMLKAMLYLQVFDNTDKGTALLKQIKTDYPTSKLAGRVDTILEQVAKQADAKKIQDQLKPGAVFPDFNVKGLDGKALSVAANKGKLVLIDFWATWCGPCRAELPNVIETYKKYHDKGFDIIGVSLDSDRAKLDDFIAKQDGMTWPQFFDGKGWHNELAEKYGVEAIPFTVLVGPDGKIIGTNLRGEKLGEAVGDALAKK